jgi:hypothetical protein
MTDPQQVRFEVLTDPEHLARRAADWLLASLQSTDDQRPVCLAVATTRSIAVAREIVPRRCSL